MEPDPGYTFESLGKYSTPRSTWQRHVEYFVDKTEWEGSAIWKSVPEEKQNAKHVGMHSSKVRVFETGIENDYINRLRNEVCSAPIPFLLITQSSPTSTEMICRPFI